MAGERTRQTFFAVGGGPQDSPGQNATPGRLRLRPQDGADALPGSAPGSAQKPPRRTSAPPMVAEGGGVAPALSCLCHLRLLTILLAPLTRCLPSSSTSMLLIGPACSAPAPLLEAGTLASLVCALPRAFHGKHTAGRAAQTQFGMGRLRQWRSMRYPKRLCLLQASLVLRRADSWPPAHSLPGFPARRVAQRCCSCCVTRKRGCAERVKVVVRVRPPFAHETGGAVSIAPEGKALALYRECAHCSAGSAETVWGCCAATAIGVVPWLQTLLFLCLQQTYALQCPEGAWCNRRAERVFGSWAQV